MQAKYGSRLNPILITKIEQELHIKPNTYARVMPGGALINCKMEGNLITVEHDAVISGGMLVTGRVLVNEGGIIKDSVACNKTLITVRTGAAALNIGQQGNIRVHIYQGGKFTLKEDTEPINK